jgi:hypothetical protein
MKVRTGFVSNSSTASFIAVTVDYSNVGGWLEKKFPVLKTLDDEGTLDDLDEVGFAEYNYGLLTIPDTDLLLHTSWPDERIWVGIDIETLLMDDWTISECGELLRARLHAEGIEIDPSWIGFRFGECSND